MQVVSDHLVCSWSSSSQVATHLFSFYVHQRIHTEPPHLQSPHGTNQSIEFYNYLKKLNCATGLQASLCSVTCAKPRSDHTIYMWQLGNVGN